MKTKLLKRLRREACNKYQFIATPNGWGGVEGKIVNYCNVEPYVERRFSDLQLYEDPSYIENKIINYLTTYRRQYILDQCNNMRCYQIAQHIINRIG